jgi:hypothetical protein
MYPSPLGTEHPHLQSRYGFEMHYDSAFRVWEIMLRSSMPFITKLMTASELILLLGKSTGSKKLSNHPAFTFIDHDDDLASKRIKDTNARKAIRSHVMRDVRRRERLVGLKRVSRREDGERSKKSDRKESIEHNLPIRGSDSLSSSPKSPSSRSPSSTARPDLVLSTSQSIDPETVSFARFLDPFSTLPGGTETPSMKSLVQYCKF